MRTLHVLRLYAQIFARGMQQELGMSREMIERVFPRLAALTDLHQTFLRSLVGAQKCSVDRSIEELGPTLILQV